MSGPKSFSTEPSFSMRMFNGMLQEVFAQQSKISQLVKRLENSRVSDLLYQIHFDCTEELQRYEAQMKEVQKPLAIKRKGMLSRERYEKLSTQIEQHASDLEQQVANLERLEADFKAKEDTYKEYIAYRDFHTASMERFDHFRQEVLQGYQMRLEEAMPELYHEALEGLNNISREMPVPAFETYTAGQSDQLRSDLLAHISQQEAEIHTLRMNISTKAFQSFENQVIAVRYSANSIPPVFSEAVLKLREIIQLRLSNCPDKPQRELFVNRFEQLTKSTTLNALFAYQQLHDDILEYERQFNFKVQVSNCLRALNVLEPHPFLQDERVKLVALGIQLLTKPKIRSNEVYDLEARYTTLLQQHQQCVREDDIKAKERLFLKTQLVEQFEEMGYVAMDDMHVIDFEKKDNYLFKTRVGNSYLNLMFRPDGSFRYVFKILEDRRILSPDQQQQKLHDMSVACEDLDTVLKDLEEMGLKINLNEAKEAHPDTIVSLNEAEKQMARAFLDRSTTRRGEAQANIKYID